jgi:ubiquinone/menaquinone biosynthesis C-methylase UbiE
MCVMCVRDDLLGEPRVQDGDPVTNPDDDATTAHASFWDRWNTEFRVRDDLDWFMQRQAAILAEVLATLTPGGRVLDVGCGTGWLGNLARSYGPVTATDLSPQAIEAGRGRYPEVDLRCGDFMSLELPGPFRLIVSSDSLVPMPDHAACLRRMAELQQPGDVLLLMTQNPVVWTRRGTFRGHDPSVPHGNPEQWPGRRQLREMLAPRYTIERLSTFAPGGDRGALFWVEHRYVAGAMKRLVGAGRWQAALERCGLGREFVIVARRR